MADAARGDLLAYLADIAIELSVLSAAKGFDALGAKFLDAAAEARRRRADPPPSDYDPNAAPADAT